MRALDHKLCAASPSAFFLAVARRIYAEGWCREYISHIDFSSVEKLAAEVSDISPRFYETILLRKRMVRYLVEQLLEQHPRHQVCILAAGLDPLGLQIAENYYQQVDSIYEIDNAFVREKQELYSAISFNDDRLFNLHIDIRNPALMMQTLIDAGYLPCEPTLIVFEGIMQYMSEEHFLRIMRAFCSRTRNNAVIMDYALPVEDLPSSFASETREIVDRMEEAMGQRVRHYSRKKILNLLSLLEAEIFDVYDMRAAEYVLNGQNNICHSRGEGMMEMVAFSI